MSTMLKTKSRISRSASRRPRAARAIMEALENRQMMSLLGVLPGLPTTNVTGAPGSMTYSASSHAMVANGVPVSILLSLSPFQVVAVDSPSGFNLNITVDNAGNVSSGTAANDLVITGSVDINGDSVPDYTGVLLTGKVTQMGSQDSGTNDNFDFRFTCTSTTPGTFGGDFFSGKDIGMVLTTENSSFNGTFTSDFTALPKGTIGPIPTSGSLPISISGFKFQDQTGDGLTADDAAHPIAGVTIQLYKDSNGSGTYDSGDTLVTSQQTTATGAYAFNGLTAGTYFVKEVTPSGYVETAPVSGLYTVNATSGAYSGLNFDNYKCGCFCGCGCKPLTLTTATSSLEGTVFSDCDKDGKQDWGEQGISGVKITLTGKDLLGNAISKTLTTDCYGHYNFTGLIAGNYTITETDPSGYTDGKVNVGTLGGTAGNDVISNITVPPCADGDCYNFAELKTGCGGGHSGHGGCRIEIRGCDDRGRQVCFTTQTDCRGDWSFDGLRGGCFTVREYDNCGRDTGYRGSCNVNWSDRDGGYKCDNQYTVSGCGSSQFSWNWGWGW